MHQYQKLMESVQGDLRKVGVDMRVQLFDATVAWGKLATQEFDMFGMSFPYVTAGEALNLYFRSQNTPTPNRMNWKNEDTDKALVRASTAVDDATRSSGFAEVIRRRSTSRPKKPNRQTTLMTFSQNKPEQASPMQLTAEAG